MSDLISNLDASKITTGLFNVPMGLSGIVADLPNGASLQAAQDAAIYKAQERYEDTGGLRVDSVGAGVDTPVGKQRVTFSDGETVLLSKEQIAALRTM